MKRCHENKFEIGDRVKYYWLQRDYINKKGTVVGWFDKDSELVAVRFDGENWASGIFPRNLRKIEEGDLKMGKADLYLVTYHYDENDKEVRIKKFAACDDYHNAEYIFLNEDWPNPQVKYVRWEVISDKAEGQRKVGSFHGWPLYESIWAAGDRDAKRLGFYYKK